MTAEISTAGVSLRRSGECILLPEANFPRPFDQIVTCHIGGISAFWYHFVGKPDIVKCRLFSQPCPRVAGRREPWEWGWDW